MINTRDEREITLYERKHTGRLEVGKTLLPSWQSAPIKRAARLVYRILFRCQDTVAKESRSRIEHGVVSIEQVFTLSTQQLQLKGVFRETPFQCL
ncbi:hypothetical protein TNCV_236201 [Trichonephila clavipes]|nr:hypothetical protein TNCV_236201 [Trichonephila clavipes]